MAYNQTIHMTPGKSDDCFLPGCSGVEGGLCIGVTDGDALDTLWWCCPPYESCRGGAQTACDYVNNSTTEVAEDQIRCTFDSQYYWCCSSAHEECPPTTALISSCSPRGFQNPALNGPIWGPNAVSTNTTNTTDSTNATTTSIISSTLFSSTIPTSSGTSLPSSTSTNTSSSGSGLSAGGAAGIGVAAFIVVLSGVFGTYLFRRRKSKPEKHDVLEEDDYPRDPPVEMQADVRMPQEIQGKGLHELAGEEPMRKLS